MPKIKRKYDSSHRKLLAEKTRQQILDSARSLFVEQGYSGTTMEDIAKSSGLAVPTLYAVFGGKRGILLKLLDEMEAAADATSLVARLRESAGDERAQLRAFIEFSVRLFTVGAPLMRIVETAGQSDPDAAALVELGNSRRLDTCHLVLAGWEQNGVLREGLSTDRAAAILWSFTGPELFGLLVHKRQWTPQEFGAWLFDLVAHQLLAEK